MKIHRLEIRTLGVDREASRVERGPNRRHD